MRGRGETPRGRVAHILRDDEDLSLCGREIVRHGVSDVTAWMPCRRCEAIAEKSRSPSQKYWVPRPRS